MPTKGCNPSQTNGRRFLQLPDLGLCCTNFVTRYRARRRPSGSLVVLIYRAAASRVWSETGLIQGNRTSEQCEKPGEVGFIPSGAHELGAQGSFCGVLLHDVQRHVAQHGEIVRAVVETGSVLILVHDDIQPPV